MWLSQRLIAAWEQEASVFTSMKRQDTMRPTVYTSMKVVNEIACVPDTGPGHSTSHNHNAIEIQV